MTFAAEKALLRSRDLTWLVLLVAIAGVIAFQAIPGPQPLDDSFITYRYARNLIAGSGFVYNPGEHVQGASTPLYTLLLALIAFPFGAAAIPTISFVIALIADVVNTVLLFRLARYLLKNDLTAFAIALVFLFQPFRAIVARGGMETSLFILILLAMYDRYLIGGKVFQAAVFASLAILTRIDALLAVAPLFAYALWKQPRRVLWAALLAAGLLAPWYVWAAIYFGNPLPQSILAKLAYYHYSTSDTLFFLLTFLGTGTTGPYHELQLIFPGLMIVLFLIIAGLRKSWLIGSAAWVVSAYPLLYFAVMTLQKAPVFFPWYYLPLMPGLLVLIFGSLQTIFQKSFQNRSPRLLIGLLCLFGLGLVIFPAVLMRVRPAWANAPELATLFRDASTSIQAEIHPGDLVMSPDIGVVGWQLGSARILDPVGLVSPVSLGYFNQDNRYLHMVVDLKPDFIVGRDEFFQFLVDQPQFLQGYHLTFVKDPVTPNADRVKVYRRNDR